MVFDKTASMEEEVMLGGYGEVPSGFKFALGYSSPFLIMAALGVTIWFFNNKKWRNI